MTGKDAFMKRIIALFSFLALTVSLSGCMSAEEKMKAEEDEKISLPIVEKYLSENYDGAKITKTTYLERNKSGAIAVPDFGVYTTGYCISQIAYGNNDFSVIVNTDTGECWDNYGYEQIKKDISKEISSCINSVKIEDIEIKFFYKDFPSLLWARDCDGFSKKGDNILTNRDYQINVLLECEGEITSLDYTALKEKDIASEVSIVAVSFADGHSSDSVALDDSTYSLSLDKDYNELYLILDKQLQIDYTDHSSDKSYSWETLPVIDYENITIGDFTFGWDANGVDVDFITANASKAYTDNRGKQYTSINGSAVTIVYDIDESSDNRQLFCWPDSEYEGEYLVLTSDGARKDNVYEIYEGYKKYGKCRNINMNKVYNNEPFTLGIYSENK